MLLENYQKILIMSCCYNEEAILPFYLDYYTNFIKVDKIILYDGGSTDGTKEIADTYKNVDFIIEKNDKMDERVLRDIRNNGWKKYKDDYDWIIVCDTDEFVYHPDLRNKLLEYTKEGVTIPLIEGFDMINKKFPIFEEGKFIINIVKRGIKDPIFLNKKVIFDPKKVEINYDFGTHSCNPTGNVKWSYKEDLKLLHYKWLSYSYVTRKSLNSSLRLSDWNMETGMASHYKVYAKISIEEFNNRYELQSDDVFQDNNNDLPIYAFSHNYLINNWEEILDEQLILIKSSKLYFNLNCLFMFVYGNDSEYKKFIEKITSYDKLYRISVNRIDKNFYEYPTIQYLYNFAKNENSNILYFHLKGVWSSLDKNKNEKAIKSWRKCLEYFNIEKWKDCIDKLKDDYDVVGALYNYDEKEPLFSGNFWWAKSDYIKKLKYPGYDPYKNPYLNTPEDDGTWCRVECEKWINTIPNKFYNFYIPKDYGFYFVPINESDYRKDDIDMNMVYNLLQNTRMFRNKNTDGDVNVLYGLKILIEKNLNKNSVVCEIGSFAGFSSELFAIYTKEVYCVDKWDIYDEVTDIDYINEAEKKFDEVCHRNKNIKKIKKSSKEACKDFDDKFFDIVYIDASHKYEDVKEDILNWLPKVKDNGFISGHDYYTWGNGVKDAVDEIFRGTNIKFYQDSSWLVKKNEILFREKEKYKISIIIPTYDRNDYLDECINSILNQGYNNLEILICHDGPSKTLDSYKFNDDKISYYHTDNRENKYGTQQRNMLLKKITGDYVLYLDDDNILYPDYFQKMVSNINENIAMLICRIHFNDNIWTNLILPRDNKIIPCQIDSLNVLIRRDIATKIEWDSMDIGHDHRYIQSCEKIIVENNLGEIKYIPDILGNHRYLGTKLISDELYILYNTGNFEKFKQIKNSKILLLSKDSIDFDVQKQIEYVIIDKRHSIMESFYNAINFGKSIGFKKFICITTNYEIDIMKIENKLSDMIYDNIKFHSFDKYFFISIL